MTKEKQAFYKKFVAFLKLNPSVYTVGKVWNEVTTGLVVFYCNGWWMHVDKAYGDFFYFDIVLDDLGNVLEGDDLYGNLYCEDASEEEKFLENWNFPLWRDAPQIKLPPHDEKYIVRESGLKESISS